MIIDVTGIELTPGNNGRDCLGNGEHCDENGEILECCCDECDYLACCTMMEGFGDCETCDDLRCPRSKKYIEQKIADKRTKVIEAGKLNELFTKLELRIEQKHKAHLKEIKELIHITYDELLK